MNNLAEKLAPLREYKEDIDHGFLLKPVAYQKIKELLLENNFYVSEEGNPNNSGTIYARNKGSYHNDIFIDFNIHSMTHGFSYLRTSNIIEFNEAYKKRLNSEKKRKKLTPYSCTLTGIGVGLFIDIPLSMAALSLDFPKEYLIIPPILVGVFGGYVGNKISKELKREEGKAIKDFWKESKQVETGWSALEKALK